MDNTKKFSGLAEDYTQGRPAYAQNFIKLLREEFGLDKNCTVADIGSGTGKLSKQILELGSIVYCVEPNDDMRAVARRELRTYNNFKSVCGEASDTTLNSCSVDFVTAAQSFHWFDTEKFKAECKRILKPDGMVILVWNTRDMSSQFNVKSYEIYKKYCPMFKGYHNGMKDDNKRITDFFDNKCQRVSFENPICFTKEKFILRSLSASYSIQNGNENFESYIKELEDLFDEYCENGIVTMKNNTVAYIGTVK